MADAPSSQQPIGTDSAAADSSIIDLSRIEPVDSRALSRDSPQWWSAHWRRTAAVLAILVLLVGTHIPRLVIGPPEDGPDKLLHFFGFAVIAILLRISDLGRTTIRTGIIAMGLAIFDEVTQELPGLNRSFDVMDLVADAGGTVTALAWCLALAPARRGSFSHRLRQVRRFAGYRFLLASPMNWIHVATGGVLGAMLVGVFLGVVGRNPIIGPITMVVVGGMTGFVAAAVLVVEAGCRHSIARIDRERRCLSCLRPTSGDGDCQRCEGRYLPAPHGEGVPDRRVLLRVSMLVLGLVLFIVGISFLRAGGVLSFRIPVLEALFNWQGRLQTSMSMALDATYLGLFAASLVWWNRRRAAIASEKEGHRCLVCGQDLQGAPHDELGRGRCSECGAEFAMDPPIEMAGTTEQGENVSR